MKYKKGTRSVSMVLENPAVSYKVVGSNVCLDQTGREAGKLKFYQVLSDCLHWERVQALPPECNEWYHVIISILGRACVIDVEIGRRTSMASCAFVKVNKIDDTDEINS